MRGTPLWYLSELNGTIEVELPRDGGIARLRAATRRCLWEEQAPGHPSEASTWFGWAWLTRVGAEKSPRAGDFSARTRLAWACGRRIRRAIARLLPVEEQELEAVVFLLRSLANAAPQVARTCGKVGLLCLVPARPLDSRRSCVPRAEEGCHGLVGRSRRAGGVGGTPGLGAPATGCPDVSGATAAPVGAVE